MSSSIQVLLVEYLLKMPKMAGKFFFLNFFRIQLALNLTEVNILRS